MKSIKFRPQTFALCSFLLLFLSCHAPSSSDSGAATVRVVSFPSLGKNCGFYLAKDFGLYHKYDLNVEIIDTYQHVLSYLESEQAEVAQVLCSEAMLAIDKGARIKIIAVRDARLPIGTISLKESNITEPVDYQNKTWGHSVEFSPEKALLPVLGEKEGFSANSVTIVHIAYPARLTALINKKVDFISAWWGSGYPPQLIHAQAQGIELDFIKWSDYGIDIYGECLVAPSNMIRNQSELLSNFLKATVEGFELALNDDAPLATSVAKHNENKTVNEEIINLQWRQSRELLLDGFSSRHGLFKIDPQKLERTRAYILNTESAIP